MLFLLLVKVPSHSQYKMPSRAQLADKFIAMVLKRLNTMGDPDACEAIAKEQDQDHINNPALIYSRVRDASNLAMNVESIVRVATNSTDPYEVDHIPMAVATAALSKTYVTMASKYSSKYNDLCQEYEDAMVAKNYPRADALCVAMSATMHVVVTATNAVEHAYGQACYALTNYIKHSKESVDKVNAKTALAKDAYSIADNAAQLTDEIIKLINEKTDVDACVAACVALARKNADKCAAAKAAEAAADDIA